MIKSKLMKKLFNDFRFVVGILVFSILVISAIFAPFFAPQDPLQTNYGNRFASPNRENLLGTDEFGRDVLSRLIYGARISLVVSTSALVIAIFGGVLFGLLGATGGKLVETITMRLVDMIFCVPPIFLAIAVVAFLGSGLDNLVLVMGVLYIPHFARITYTSALSIQENDYVLAARALGCRKIRIVLKHILPNIISPIIVQVSFSLGALILLESGLSFLGLGVTPPTASWGLMLGRARSYLFSHGLLMLWPALTMAITVLTINIVGDSLRDALDPKGGRKLRF